MNSFDLMTKFMYDCKVEYLYDAFDECKFPWELINKIGDKIKELVETPPDGFKVISQGVIVGENVDISSMSTIIPPAVIGHNTQIRPGAYLRGNVITGSGCVIGNSSELKNCILLDNVQIPHYNYVGDSVLGNYAHLGAGTVCSNLKTDKSNIYVHAHIDYDTKRRKLGAMLADGVEVGCNCVLNPGTVICKNSTVYPLTSVRGVVPSDCIVKSMENIIMRKDVL